jgi:hypothetical protein
LRGGWSQARFGALHRTQFIKIDAHENRDLIGEGKMVFANPASFRPWSLLEGFKGPSAPEEMQSSFNDLDEKGLRAGPLLFFVSLSQFLDMSLFDNQKISKRDDVAASLSRF